jgi:hypothetical protein
MSELVAHVVDGLVGGHWHHQTHCCHHQSKTHGRRGLLPHHRGGGSWRTWWDVTGNGRQHCPVQEAHSVASHCICPHRVWVVQWAWMMARHAGVGVVHISAMRMTVVPIFKRLEQGGWLQRALATRKSFGLLIRRRGWILNSRELSRELDR